MADTEKDWNGAKAYFDEVMDQYMELMGMPGVIVGPALMMTFEPLLRRYNSGERTDELYASMMEVK